MHIKVNLKLAITRNPNEEYFYINKVYELNNMINCVQLISQTAKKTLLRLQSISN